MRLEIIRKADREERLKARAELKRTWRQAKSAARKQQVELEEKKP
jgi:hypothetical protein